MLDSQPTVAWPVCLNAFAQFSRYEVQTSHTGQGLSGAGRGGVDGSTVPRLRNKGFITEKNVNSTCVRTVFKIQSWNFTGTSMTHRDRSWRGWRFYGTPVETSKDVVWQSADGRLTSDHCRVTVQWLFSKNFLIARNVQKRSLTVGRRSRDLRPLSRDRSATFFKISPNCLKRRKNVVWQSADGHVTSDHCRVTVQWLFSKNFPNCLKRSKKRCLTVGRRSRDLRPLSRDRSATFFEIFPNCLKRPKNVVWQSADGRVTSDHCRVTVQRLFSKFSQIAWNVNKYVVWQSADGRLTSDHCRVTVQRLFSKHFLIARNVQKTLFDSRPTVAWPPTTVAWLFSDFFQKIFPNCLKRSKNRCLTVGRRSRDLRPLSRDRSATFFKKFSQIAWNVQKTLFDSRPTVAWPPTTVAWLFSDFFQKNVLIAWNVEKSLFDSRPTVAWPPTTVAWPFSDFFQNFRQIAWNVQKTLFDSQPTVCVTSDHCRVTVQRLNSKFLPNRLKRRKYVVWQSADGRLTSDHCRVTVQRLFSKFSQIAWNVQKTMFDSRPTVAWPPTTVAWLFSDFFQKNFPNCLKRRKIVVWQPADGRVTSDHCRVTVQRLFSKNFHKLLETSKKRCLTVGRRSRDLRPLSRDCSATFFKKISLIAWNVEKSLFDSRPTVAWPPTTVAWLFSDFFQKILPNCLKRPKNVVWQSADGRVTSDHCRVTVQQLFSKFSQIAWNVQNTLFDSRPTVAWPPTTVAWPFSDFFQKIFPNRLKRPKNVVWQSADGRVTSDHCRVTVQRLFSKILF